MWPLPWGPSVGVFFFFFEEEKMKFKSASFGCMAVSIVICYYLRSNFGYRVTGMGEMWSDYWEMSAVDCLFSNGKGLTG
jgi:hypothetical protein